MNTSFKTTKISASFLAVVLIAGSIAATFPNFMVGAQAEPYYGMDKDRNSDKKKVSVSSLKCNNINVNVNGLELDVFPPFLGGGLAAEAAEGTTDASSFGGNGGSNGGSEVNDFRFICINNNNNTVAGADDDGGVTPPPEPPVACEDCFEDFLSGPQLIELEAALSANGGVTVNVLGEDITITSLLDLCLDLEALSIAGIVELIVELLDQVGIILDLDVLIDLILCILADLELEIEVLDILEILIDLGIIGGLPGAGALPSAVPTT